MGVVELLSVIAYVLYYWMKAIVMAFVPTSCVAKDISGQTVLITGAGSGIGRLLALEFAAHNCRLALWDLDDRGNAETARLAQDLGATVRTYTVDVSDREAVYALASKVTSEIGQVDILVNNAGIVTGGKFMDCPDSKIAKTMEVNTMGHFWMVKAFLPAMLSRNHGHIVTVASSAGLIGVTGLADYCASKFGAVGFEESLRNELYAMGKTGVHTTVVCPYLISTGMFDGCQDRYPWLLSALDPEYVVDQIMKAILRNQELLVLPKLLYTFVALKGLLPVKCMTVVSDCLGANNMMDNFRGRAPS